MRGRAAHYRRVRSRYARRSALARFATVPGFEPEEVVHPGFGTVGRLSLGDGVRVDVTEIPGEREQRPLWRPFATGAVGALVLLPADEAAPLLHELAKVLRLHEVPRGVDDGLVISLTPEGQAIVGRIRETVVTLENELLSPFSDSEIAQTAEFIGRLESTVNDVRERMKR